MPCEQHAGDFEMHDPGALAAGSYGSSVMDSDRQSLSEFIPISCPLGPRERIGVEWEVAAARMPGEADEVYVERLTQMLGYPSEGEEDDQYQQALGNIYERRDNDTDIRYAIRVSVLRLGVRSLVSNLPRL